LSGWADRVDLDESHFLIVALNAHSLHLGCWHHEVSGSQVGWLSHSRELRRLQYRDFVRFNSGLNMLSIFVSNHFLVNFDRDPAQALGVRVFSILTWFSDFFIFLILVGIIVLVNS